MFQISMQVVTVPRLFSSARISFLKISLALCLCLLNILSILLQMLVVQFVDSSYPRSSSLKRPAPQQSSSSKRPRQDTSVNQGSYNPRQNFPRYSTKKRPPKPKRNLDKQSFCQPRGLGYVRRSLGHQLHDRRSSSGVSHSTSSNFLPSSSCSSQLFSASYDLKTSFPNASYTDLDKTLKECGLVPNATLHIVHVVTR